jgi:hypothetical protein
MKLGEVLKLSSLALLAGMFGILLSTPKSAFADAWGKTLIINGSLNCDCTHPTDDCMCIDT